MATAVVLAGAADAAELFDFPNFIDLSSGEGPEWSLFPVRDEDWRFYEHPPTSR